MKHNSLISITFALFLVLIANAQSYKKAVKDYDDLSYVESAKELLKIAEMDNPPSEILEKLGNAYYFNNKMEDASKWYGLLLSKNEADTNAELYYRYAMSLKTLVDYDEAKKWLEKFAEAKPDDSRAIMFKNAPDYLETIANLSGNYELESVNFNSPKSDFAPSFYKDGVVFSSSRGTGDLYSWNSQPFLDLYIKDIDTAAARLFSFDLNTKLHESSTSFSKDGKTVYFTRNNYYDGAQATNDNQVVGLKIYRATLIGDYWTNITPMPFNNDNYNVAHPTLSADGTKLFFASDMPGTLGESDIYVVSVIDNKGAITYTKPQNLGPKVNTSGKENFPFISDNLVLYFSSNGHPGLGGLDVFKLDLNDENSTPENVGKPVNSSFDDFGFVINDDTEVGYFTSNREGGVGDDDIYKIKVFKCETEISGKVVDKETKDVIPNAEVVIFKDDTEIHRLQTNKDGKFNYSTDCRKSYTYTAKVTKGDYEPYDKTFSVEERNNAPIQLKFSLLAPEPEVKAAEAGTDLFKLLGLKPINFDVNKAIIRKDAQTELQKVINYLKEFPKVKIDVRSHTDSRGSDAYNLSLSKKRNTATKNWIIAKGGIAPERVSGKGYGETKLLNRCKNGVKCSKKEHEKNRRSEFIVVANN